MVEKVTQLQETLDEDDQREMHRFIQGTKLGDEPEEPHDWLPFHFNEGRVFKAVVSRPRDVDDKTIKDWTELPAHVAAGIYRDLIHPEMYDNLFKPMIKGNEPKSYPI